MTIAFTPSAQATTKAPQHQTGARPGIAAGTVVLTQTGARAIESLQVGDKVITRDHGFQPLRWIGTSISESGAIHFAANAMGTHDAVTLAPTTRVLIRNPLAKALFGEAEVFAIAADLVNDTTICTLPDSRLNMVHVLFEHHEILRAAEMEVESLHPDRALMRQLDAETQATILRLLPNSDAFMGYGYGPTARTCLRRSEARMFAPVC
ncbi:MAG: Hint domain-containing protein [Cypionkella sp.]